MGIDSMLNQNQQNQKAGPSVPSQAAHPLKLEHHQLQPHPQMSQIPQIPLERSGSPHGSEHSRYSAPPVNGMDASRPYGSPSAMHAVLHMPEPNMAAPGMVLPGLPASLAPGMPQVQSGLPYNKPLEGPAQVPQKAYPCSTCGKGFARRSDLARHGMLAEASSDGMQTCD